MSKRSSQDSTGYVVNSVFGIPEVFAKILHYLFIDYIILTENGQRGIIFADNEQRLFVLTFGEYYGSTSDCHFDNGTFLQYHPNEKKCELVLFKSNKKVEINQQRLTEKTGRSTERKNVIGLDHFVSRIIENTVFGSRLVSHYWNNSFKLLITKLIRDLEIISYSEPYLLFPAIYFNEIQGNCFWEFVYDCKEHACTTECYPPKLKGDHVLRLNTCTCCRDSPIFLAWFNCYHIFYWECYKKLKSESGTAWCKIDACPYCRQNPNFCVLECELVLVTNMILLEGNILIEATETTLDPWQGLKYYSE